MQPKPRAVRAAGPSAFKGGPDRSLCLSGSGDVAPHRTDIALVWRYRRCVSPTLTTSFRPISLMGCVAALAFFPLSLSQVFAHVLVKQAPPQCSPVFPFLRWGGGGGWLFRQVYGKMPNLGTFMTKAVVFLPGKRPVYWYHLIRVRAVESVGLAGAAQWKAPPLKVTTPDCQTYPQKYRPPGNCHPRETVT